MDRLGIGSTGLLGRAAAVVLLSVGLGACGAGDDGAGDDGVGEVEGFGSRTWSAAEIGPEPGTVVLTVLAPQGDGCEEPMSAEVWEAPYGADAWEIMVRVPPDPPPAGCDVGERTLEVELPDGTNDRDLISAVVLHRHRATPDGYELDPSSTPCGRADCSGVAPVAAPCDEAGVGAALATLGDEIDPGGSAGACDGSFLWVNFTTGGSGCPPTGGDNPCAHEHGAWFISREGVWSVLAWDMPDCDILEQAILVRATDEVCADPTAAPTTP